MRNKISSVKSYSSIHQNSLLNSNVSDNTSHTSSKRCQRLLDHYKRKSEKLERDFGNLLIILDQVKSVCDFSEELQRELSARNEEVSTLQHIVGELQIQLFREKEHNFKLCAEIEKLKIEDYDNKKRINALLKMTGMCERKVLHFVTKCSQDKLVEPKLPSQLQILKETKEAEMLQEFNGTEDEMDPQILLLNNQLLTSQLEQHTRFKEDEISLLLKEREVSEEERKVERQRLQQEIDLLTSKLKKCQDLLCETTGKMVKSQQTFEKEKTNWIEEKNKYLQTIGFLNENRGLDVNDIVNYCLKGIAASKFRSSAGQGSLRDSALLEKEQLTAAYQEQIVTLEAEVNRLREKAQFCKNKFKEKTEKMTAEVSYLRNKYEDLYRRRQLEAEGFRTDIRMLRERVKEVEKKLSKASATIQHNEEQQLLISARSTLNRAKQLAKELVNMKSKISVLESNGESLS